MTGELPVVGFLVAAGQNIGGGHVMRCLSIARALRSLGASIYFFSGTMQPLLAARCAAQGVLLEAVSLQDAKAVDRSIGRSNVNVLVVDGYGFDESWRKQLMRSHRPLVVLDDLNDPPVYTADAIINALPNADHLGYCRSAPDADSWLGPEFTPLSPEFACPVVFEPETRNDMLISFGASDPAGHTLPLLEAMLTTMPEVPPSSINIVTGPMMDAQQVKQVQALAGSHPCFEHHHDCQDMRQLMLRSGLAVSAAGGTIYELAACGVPTLAVAVSRNQQYLSAALKQQSAWCEVWNPKPRQPKDLAQATWRLWSDSVWRQSAMVAARHWLDGKGSLRLAQRILALALDGARS